MIDLYHSSSESCSGHFAKAYSTSFSFAIGMLHKDLRVPICNIYGFVRLADEIVDTFHDHDKERLLSQFKVETYQSIKDGISLNPILHSFQRTVNKYLIDHDLIEAFFKSMEMDLYKTEHDHDSYHEYIYGSAEVVGLMCLQVFCEGDKKYYEQLRPAAKALGSAFQKVNFLRDIKADYVGLSRIYFPGCDFNSFTLEEKRAIEKNIQIDFDAAYNGIKALPYKAKLGVYIAYRYYKVLFNKINKLSPEVVVSSRVRISNSKKVWILAVAFIKSKLGLV